MAKITKTTAINDYNTAVVKQSGRVGTVRYYTKNGLTYVRAASNSQVTNNRTNAQMTQRLAFASLSALGEMSVCRLVATESMFTIINGYLTEAAFANASASYGKSSEMFLIPARRSMGDACATANDN